MPSTSLMATTTETHEVKLSPSMRRKLLTELRAYAAVKEQMKALEHAVEKHKTTIGKLREETGEQAIAIDGFRVCLVAPIRKKFNGQKYVALGGDIAIYNQAHDEVPGRPYEKITLTNEANNEE